MTSAGALTPAVPLSFVSLQDPDRSQLEGMRLGARKADGSRYTDGLTVARGSVTKGPGLRRPRAQLSGAEPLGRVLGNPRHFRLFGLPPRGHTGQARCRGCSANRLAGPPSSRAPASADEHSARPESGGARGGRRAGVAPPQFPAFRPERGRCPDGGAPLQAPGRGLEHPGGGSSG